MSFFAATDKKIAHSRGYLIKNNGKRAIECFNNAITVLQYFRKRYYGISFVFLDFLDGPCIHFSFFSDFSVATFRNIFLAIKPTLLMIL